MFIIVISHLPPTIHSQVLRHPVPYEDGTQHLPSLVSWMDLDAGRFVSNPTSDLSFPDLKVAMDADRGIHRVPPSNHVADVKTVDIQ